MKINRWKNHLESIQNNYPFGDLKEYRNEEGRLHRDNGPAYISRTRCTWYQNGRKHGVDVDIFGSICYYYEGICVPPQFFNDPESISFDWLFTQPNTEVRYVGIKLLGIEEAHDAGYIKKIDEQEVPYRKLYLCNSIPNMQFCIVQLLNSTAELDGTFKKYFLTVPPNMTSCQEAVAWTFGKSASEYHPEQET